MIGIIYVGYTKIDLSILSNKPIEIIPLEIVEETTESDIFDAFSDEILEERSESLNIDNYYYYLLNNQEKSLYQDMVEAYFNYNTTIDLSVYYSDMENDAVQKVHWYVLLDYPEIFWVGTENKVTYIETEDGKSLKELNVTNYYSEDEIIIYEESLSQKFTWINQIVGEAETDYDKALAIYEYIIWNCTYDDVYDNELEEAESATIIGVLLNGEAICSGYAKAYSYLLNLLDIETISVVGYAEGNGHEWNIIVLDGEFYHVDSTWGDPLLEEYDEDYISYDYFCLTSELINRTHTEMEDIIYPICTAETYNYYTYNDLYFDYYNYDLFSAKVAELFNSGVSNMTFRFGSKEEYDIAVTALIEEDLGKIVYSYTDILANECGYRLNEELYLISLEFVFK